MVHIVLHVFLSCVESAFADLVAHLCGGIVDEATECWEGCSSSSGVPVIGCSIIRIALRLGWRGGSHHGHGGDMLGDRVMQWRRMGGRGSVGTALHCLGAVLMYSRLLPRVERRMIVKSLELKAVLSTGVEYLSINGKVEAFWIDGPCVG